MTTRRTDTTWERFRYGPLIRSASRGESIGRVYAAIVAWVEWRREANRRRVAEERIARWVGTSSREAARIFRGSLYSEALEEADSARLMRSSGLPTMPIEVKGLASREERPRIYASLHAGSPVLAYIGLRAQFEPEARIIARELDENNPMASSKRRFARRKVAWVEATCGARFFKTDAEAILEARQHLIAGRPLFAAVDVPGDVVSRADRTLLFGEQVVLASGIFRLAAMTGADMQLVVSARGKRRVLVDCGRPINGSDTLALQDAMLAQMEEAIRRWPDEFWFWPFFVSSTGSAP